MSRSEIPVIPVQKCLVATDLHCDGSARRLTWLRRLLNRCQQLEASLLLLGDLFDQWCGDDQMNLDVNQHEVRALRSAIREGLQISVIPGNRDFLLGSRFESHTGIQIHGDAVEIQRGGQRWHCSHGDLFGTEDRGYQRLRKTLRHPLTRGVLLSMPMSLRQFLAGGIRSGSKRSVRRKHRTRMQPDLRMVESLIAEGYDRVLCGHFHVSRQEVVHCAGRSGEFQILEPFEERGAYLNLCGMNPELEWVGESS